MSRNNRCFSRTNQSKLPCQHLQCGSTVSVLFHSFLFPSPPQQDLRRKSGKQSRFLSWIALNWTQLNKHRQRFPKLWIWQDQKITGPVPCSLCEFNLHVCWFNPHVDWFNPNFGQLNFNIGLLNLQFCW